MRILTSLLPALGLATACTPVSLEIHIMSQCPDAVDCFHDLISPALDDIPSEMVAFRMSFIGRTLSDGGVVCKHGPVECLGNMLHLCAIEINTPPDPPPTDRYFGFSGCLLQNYPGIGNKTIVEECAKEGGIDFGKLNDCISDMEGEKGGAELLKSSIERSEELGVRASCTVRVDGKQWCIRDGGQWRDCPGGSEVEGLVKEVKKLYREKNGEDDVSQKERNMYEKVMEAKRVWMAGL